MSCVLVCSLFLVVEKETTKTMIFAKAGELFVHGAWGLRASEKESWNEFRQEDDDEGRQGTLALAVISRGARLQGHSLETLRRVAINAVTQFVHAGKPNPWSIALFGLGSAQS